jgi:hypothetical protein
MRTSKGQSTVEYILLFTAVVTVLILFLNSDRSPLKLQLNNTYSDMTDQMGNLTRRLTGTVAPPYIPEPATSTVSSSDTPINGGSFEGTTFTPAGPSTPVSR